jgi:hypothetical protein
VGRGAGSADFIPRGTAARGLGAFAAPGSAGIRQDQARSRRRDEPLFHQFNQAAELGIDLAELKRREFGGVSEALRRALGLLVADQGMKAPLNNWS